MKIARYIGDLLFEYECIVIPGFGGFITKEVPAKIHPVQNHFIPPSKEIVFNVHLKANDGLLINHIARSEKINYTEAKMRLENFVERCEAALKNGKRIHFRKVGTLTLNKEGFKQFEPDTTQNYLADSYGLKSFISPPIKRSIGVRPVKKQVAQDRKAEEVYRKTSTPPAPKKKTNEPRYIRLNISAILILMVFAAFIIFKFGTVKKYYSNYSSLIPFFYSNPNNYIIENYKELGINKVYHLKFNWKEVGDKLNINYELPSEKTVNEASDELNAEAETKTDAAIATEIKDSSKIETQVVPTESLPVKPEITSNITRTETEDNSPKYYIIAGVFQNVANADKYVLQLREKGFNADIIGMNKYQQYRVYFDRFSSMSEANSQLAIIRSKENDSAWILSL